MRGEGRGKRKGSVELMLLSLLYMEHTKVPGKGRGRRTFLHGLREGKGKGKGKGKGRA